MKMDEGSVPSEAVVDDAPPAERGHRKVRAGAQVVGVVGLIVCAVLAIGILLARAWISDGIGGVFETADRQVERASTIVELATSRLEERVTDVDDFIATVSALTPGANLPPAIASRAATIADRYDAVRDQFIALRARVESALETIQQVDRMIPFIDLPTGPTDELAQLDERIKNLDMSLGQLREGAAGQAVIQRVVDGATTLRSTIDQVSDVGARFDTRLSELQLRIAEVASRVDGYLWLLTVVLLLLVGYLAVLNALVIWLARR